LALSILLYCCLSSCITSLSEEEELKGYGSRDGERPKMTRMSIFTGLSEVYQTSIGNIEKELFNKPRYNQWHNSTQ
jgi:hypothetical protein